MGKIKKKYTKDATNILCDMNRGGNKFLQRKNAFYHHRHRHRRIGDHKNSTTSSSSSSSANGNDDDSENNGNIEKKTTTDTNTMMQYPSSLWPIIVNLVFKRNGLFPDAYYSLRQTAKLFFWWINDVNTRRNVHASTIRWWLMAPLRIYYKKTKERTRK